MKLRKSLRVLIYRGVESLDDDDDKVFSASLTTRNQSLVMKPCDNDICNHRTATFYAVRCTADLNFERPSLSRQLKSSRVLQSLILSCNAAVAKIKKLNQVFRAFFVCDTT